MATKAALSCAADGDLVADPAISMVAGAGDVETCMGRVGARARRQREITRCAASAASTWDGLHLGNRPLANPDR